MAKFFDKDGNEVEAFTKEEVDAQISEKLDGKKEEINKETPPIVPPVKEQPVDMAAVLARLDKVEKENNSLKVEKLADRFAGEDVEKRSAFLGKFEKLSGYEDTADGLATRAKDAAVLAFGADAPGILVSTAAGGKNPDDVKQVTNTEADKVVQNALGLSADDIKKYGADQK